jgi:hypothetical protein
VSANEPKKDMPDPMSRTGIGLKATLSATAIVDICSLVRIWKAMWQSNGQRHHGIVSVVRRLFMTCRFEAVSIDNRLQAARPAQDQCVRPAVAADGVVPKDKRNVLVRCALSEKPASIAAVRARSPSAICRAAA